RPEVVAARVDAHARIREAVASVPWFAGTRVHEDEAAVTRVHVEVDRIVAPGLLERAPEPFAGDVAAPGVVDVPRRREAERRPLRERALSGDLPTPDVPVRRVHGAAVEERVEVLSERHDVRRQAFDARPRAETRAAVASDQNRGRIRDG